VELFGRKWLQLCLGVAIVVVISLISLFYARGIVKGS
jgi:hypothetical protein